MNIVIVGVGNVGQELVAQLVKENHNLIVVDSNEKKLEYIVNRHDVKGIFGNGASVDVLTEADIANVDLLVACTPMDEMNILCCMVAKKLGAKETVARVRTPEYFTLFQGRELGLSMMVNPEYETALGIARMLRYSSAIKMEPFADGKVDLVEVKITPKMGLAGLELKNLNQRFTDRVLICAVERKGVVYIPTGNFQLEMDDNIYITASSKSISGFFKQLSDDRGCRRVMIIGGYRIAVYLAKELVKLGIKVTIIEQDAAKCNMLSESLDKVDVILGDGTNQELLLDEGLERTDALISLCGLDEQNIIVAMFAQRMNVRKVVAKVDKSSYYKMLQGSNIDSIVSTKTSTADQIVRYVRGKLNTAGGSVNKLYRILNEQAEAIEFTVSANFTGLHKPLKELRLVPNLLIATIIRNNDILIPAGNDTLEINDIVVIVTTNDALDDLNDILE